MIPSMTRRAQTILLLTLAAALHAAVLLAGFFAPYDPEEQNRNLPFAPPVRLHFIDEEGSLHLRPFIYTRAERPGAFGEYEEDRSRRYPVRFFVAGTPYRLAGLLPARIRLFGVEEPARVSLCGTDGFGRDVFSRMLAGGRISLLAGVLATMVTLLIGSLIGAVAGFYGGWMDALLMRGAELFLALPWIYLLLAFRAFLPLHIGPSEAFLLVILVIAAVGWARPARLVRGVVLSARERDYVRAARGFGATDIYLLRRHVLPQTFGVLRTQALLLVSQYVLAEVTLSFFGLGVSEPVPSLGNMLGTLMQYHVLVSYWWLFLPGLLLALFVGLYSALAARLGGDSRAPSW